MENILPEVVAMDKTDQPFGIDYPVLTSVLTKAIQEQQVQIASLSAEIKLLKDGSVTGTTTINWDVGTLTSLNIQSLNITSSGSAVVIEHASGFDSLSLKMVKEVVIDAPVAMVKNLWAKGNVITEGIKKTYYAVAALWPNVDIGIMVANWGTRDIMISNNVYSSVFAMFSGNGAQAAEQSKTDLAENDAYPATYGVDSTCGEIQLSESSDLVSGGSSDLL